MIKKDYFDMPIITYEEIRNRGHKQQMGIYKPRDSKYAASIITNVGETRPNYEDNLDEDLTLTYHGRGKDKDQTLEDYDNKALSLNFEDQIPVRVFAGGDNRYRDWGFWRIIDLDTVIGHDGNLKLVYKLIPTSAEEINQRPTEPNTFTTTFAKRKMTTINRLVRYAPELRKLKEAYGYRCQVDQNHNVLGRNGSKVVVHHLEPVGLGGALVSPNHRNEIVLCPNCHALFDDGSLFIDSDDTRTIHHWDKDPIYEGKTLELKDWHKLDSELLARVYQLHRDK